MIVLTHHPRPPLTMNGGTAFHFVDAKPAEALERARALAGDLDVRIGGGVTTIRQFLEADLIDQMHIVLVPIFLGRGERLWDGLEGLEQRFQIEAAPSPSGVVHLKLRPTGPSRLAARRREGIPLRTPAMVENSAVTNDRS